MEKRLECIKELLVACVEEQVKCLEEVDAKELGEVIDIIKDIDESIYYSTVTKAMKEYDGDDYKHYEAPESKGGHEYRKSYSHTGHHENERDTNNDGNWGMANSGK
jgi:hypothetical protein